MRKPSPIAHLIEIARQGVPFTADDGQVFVSVPVPPGCTLPVRSPAYRDWFFYRVYAQYDAIPTANAFNAILNLLEAQANVDARQRFTVSRRVASRGPGYIPSQILLDLGNPDCQFVEISPDGWKTTTGNQPLFQTSRSTIPLPAPQPSPAESPAPGPCSPDPRPLAPASPTAASLAPGPQPPAPAFETLRSCLNLPSRAAWLRCLAWLLAAFRPHGPYPFLILQGPPASGKSLATRLLRYLIDPSTAPLSPIPSSVRDLLALARHNWILAFDHISTLSPPLTDALCRLSSGLGAASHETSRPTTQPLLQYYKRPVLLNVTSRWSCPPDLAERAFIVTLPPLSPACRVAETALLTAFNQARPAILGALCSAVSTALARLPQMNLPPGKCADALAWAVAASPALGCAEEEMHQALTPPPPPHPIVEAVRTLIEQRRQWTGSATELLDLLQPALSCHTPKGVSHQLRSCMLTLADGGIELKFRRLHGGARVIDLREDPGDAWDPKSPPHASPDFAPSPQPTESEEFKA